MEGPAAALTLSGSAELLSATSLSVRVKPKCMLLSKMSARFGSHLFSHFLFNVCHYKCLVFLMGRRAKWHDDKRANSHHTLLISFSFSVLNLKVVLLQPPPPNTPYPSRHTHLHPCRPTLSTRLTWQPVGNLFA